MVIPSDYGPFHHNVDAPDHGRLFRVTPLLSAGGAVEDDIRVAAGRARINQTIHEFATHTDLLALANGTNRVYISAAGAITAAVVGAYPANTIPLARVEVAGGIITGITDDRCVLAGGF